MAVKRVRAKMDVVEAAKIRIKNIFANKVPVYFSFSGGKDSLVVADIILKLIKKNEIDTKLLTVIFIDEEAMYESAIEMVYKWRKIFLLHGAQFHWYCVEVKHFSCYNALTSDESYTCWDRTKRNAWIREPPLFAIRNHPALRPGIDSYQTFLPKITRDGVQIIGVRASESVQRLQYMAQLNIGIGASITNKNFVYPIYDWRTSDVWLYLYRNKVDIPVTYLRMYQVGIGKNQLRISQFFSVDCVGTLIHLAKYEPGLWERILRREPNAYLATLYWDSELYRRSSKKRRETEAPKDYKALLKKMLVDEPEKHFTTNNERKVAESYKKLMLKWAGMIRQRDYKRIHDALVAGDPKLRTFRAVNMDIATANAEHAKKYRRQGGEKHALKS